MRVWNEYGSEHSANLVMIGHFKEAGGARKAKDVLDWLVEQVEADLTAGLMDTDRRTERYTDGMMAVLKKAAVYDVAPVEMEQFAYDVTVKLSGEEIVITTDESDVSAFLKVLIDKGARVDVYSAHVHPGTGRGRGQ